MSKIVIYSSNTCPQCKGAKMFLNSKNILFEEKNVDDNPAYKEEVSNLGFNALPLIVTKGLAIQPFTGFDTAKLRTIVKELAPETVKEI